MKHLPHGGTAAAIMFVFACVLAPHGVSAQSAFTIEDFHSDIAIQADGRIHVVETIRVSFHSEAHGIFRDIPVAYEDKDGKVLKMDVDIQSVTDGERAYEYAVTRNKRYLRVKIGDPAVLLSGPHQYVIEYTASGALMPYDSYDELYWNVTGNEWEAPIARASVSVILPKDGIESASCYQGVRGSAEKCETTQTSPRAVRAETTRALLPREGFTIALAYSKGLVPIPAPVEEKQTPLTELIDVFIGIVFAGVLFVLYLWWRFGRDIYYERKSLHDPDAREADMPLFTHETVIAEYEPPEGLRPGEIGVLMDERADVVDVSATIVGLAIRGHLTIEEIPKKWMFGSTDYMLVRTANTPQDGSLLPHEQKLLAALFDGRNEVAVSELKNSFHASLKEVKELLYADVVEKKLFVGHPERIRTRYRLWGGAVAAIGVAITIVPYLVGYSLEALWPISIGLGISLTGALFIVAASAMPRRSARGRELYRQARGYKLFVSGTEKYRQPFFEDRNMFMEVLPYAMVFGVTAKLANAMKDMGITPPAPLWYRGIAPFDLAVFSTSMSTFQSSLSNSISSAPSGSGGFGGGFSGGGFGGGGGGSW